MDGCSTSDDHELLLKIYLGMLAKHANMLLPGIGSADCWASKKGCCLRLAQHRSSILNVTPDTCPKVYTLA